MADSPVAATPTAAAEAAAPAACAPSPPHVIDLLVSGGAAMPTAPPPPNNKNKARDPVKFMQRWMPKSKGELVQCMAALRLNFAMHCHSAQQHDYWAARHPRLLFSCGSAADEQEVRHIRGCAAHGHHVHMCVWRGGFTPSHAADAYGLAYREALAACIQPPVLLCGMYAR